MDNNEIVKIAQGCLRDHSYGPIRQVVCRIEGGELLLSGTLPTFYMKQLAFHAVQGKVNGTDICIKGLRVAGYDGQDDAENEDLS